MLSDGVSCASSASFSGTSPRESFARPIAQVSFITSLCGDSMDGLKLILESFLLFVPPGDINTGLAGVFLTMKMPKPPSSDTEPQLQR